MRSQLTAIILDDEDDGIFTLTEQLKMYCPQVEIIGKFNDAVFGLEKIMDLRPDIAFLDIHMPKMSGLEIAQQIIPKGIHVIFVTAHQEYAVNALRLTALDYLLKPLQEPQELVDAVTRLRGRLAASETGAILQRLLDNENKDSYSQETEIVLGDDKHIIFPKVKEIIRLEANGNYCTFILTDKRNFTVTKNIGSFTDSLRKYGILRANRSEAINLAHKVKVIRHGPYLEMSDNHKVLITDTYRSDFPF